MNYSIIPSHFFVGDRVKLITKLDESHNITQTSFDITKIEQNDVLTINDISISSIDGMPCLVIEFTPWQIGELTFPSLQDIALDIELPTIKVASILEVEGVPQNLQDAREPILLDGTVFMIYRSIGSAVILLLFITFFILWLKKKGKIFWTNLSNNYALFLFSLRLRWLSRDWKNFPSENEIKTLDASLAKGLKEKNRIMKRSWAKNYETAFRVCLASIYRTQKSINWDALTYQEIEKVIAIELEKYVFNETDVQKIKKSVSTLTNSKDKTIEPTNSKLQNLQNITDIFQHLSTIRFAEYNKNEQDTKEVFCEEELIALSFKFISLHKKRKLRNSTSHKLNMNNSKLEHSKC